MNFAKVWVDGTVAYQHVRGGMSKLVDSARAMVGLKMTATKEADYQTLCIISDILGLSIKVEYGEGSVFSSASLTLVSPNQYGAEVAKILKASK